MYRHPLETRALEKPAKDEGSAVKGFPNSPDWVKFKALLFGLINFFSV
jgi:hypothetical protein